MDETCAVICAVSSVRLCGAFLLKNSYDVYNQVCPEVEKNSKKESTITYTYVNDVNLTYTEVLQVNGKESTPLHTYIYGVQRIQDDKRGERTQYYNYDGKGSVIGKQVGNDLHLAFKVKYNDDGKPSRNMDNEFGYNGEAHNYHGTQYLRARYYDTNIGRFNQRDPYRGELHTPISQNRYTYVWNNALKYHDKSGNKLLLDHGRQDPKLDETVNLQDYYYQQHKNGKMSDEAYYRSEAEIWRDYQKHRNPSEILPSNERNPNYPTLSEYIKEQERLAEEAKQRMKDEIKAIEDELKAAGIVVAKWNIAGYSTEEKLRILREIKKICEELGMGIEHFDKNKAQQEVDNYVADNKYTPWDFTKKWVNENKDTIKAVILGTVVAVVVLATGGLALAGASMGTVALGSVLSSILGSTITVTGANLTATALIALVAGYINMNYILPDINNDYIRGTLQDINTFGMMFGLAGLASQALDYLGKKGQDWLNKKHPTNIPKYSISDPSSFEGGDIKDVERYLDENLEGFIKDNLKKGDGIRYYNGKGTSYQLNYGYENSWDDIHGGPYMKISSNGKIIRILLKR